MRTLRLVLTALLLAGLSMPANAQTSWKNQIAVTGGAKFPMETLDDNWKTGAGVDVTYYYRPSSRFFIGLHGGYHHFEAQTGSGTLDIIPLHLASKFNLSLSGLQPYLGLDGGLYARIEDDEDTDEEEEETLEFGVAPQVGFRIPIASGVDIDLNVTYQVLLNDSDRATYIGVNAGLSYIFGD